METETSVSEDTKIVTSVNHMHLRGPVTETNGREVTVAYNYNEEDKTLSFGFAFCSKADSYNKKIGNELASNRLVAYPLSLEFETIPTATEIKKTVRTLLGKALYGDLMIKGFPRYASPYRDTPSFKVLQ